MDILKDNPVKPDVEMFISVIKREKNPRRVHFIELFLDEEVKEAICKHYDLDNDLSAGDPYYKVKRDVKVYRFLGYDVFRVPIIRKDFFTLTFLEAEDTTYIKDQKRGEREWSEEHRGPIQNWEDFERYPWPEVSDINFSQLEWLEKNMPPDMGCYDLTAHILEMLTFLLGYETLCYKMVDEPQLVDAVLEKVGKFYVDYTRALCDFSCVPLVWGSDDMGFHTSTLVSPGFLRDKILPWHKRCAEVGHEKGKPYLIHNCGNIAIIMDDLIDYVKIDARHSFEDSILPVTEAWKQYGKRISILGGIDVDFLCRSDEKAIRERVRKTLDICINREGSDIQEYPPGGYCLGTGNTVANYIPIESYLIMLDEGRRYGI